MDLLFLGLDTLCIVWGVVGDSENKANLAKFKLSWGLACAEFGKSRLFG